MPVAIVVCYGCCQVAARTAASAGSSASPRVKHNLAVRVQDELPGIGAMTNNALNTRVGGIALKHRADAESRAGAGRVIQRIIACVPKAAHPIARSCIRAQQTPPGHTAGIGRTRNTAGRRTGCIDAVASNTSIIRQRRPSSHTRRGITRRIHVVIQQRIVV